MVLAKELDAAVLVVDLYGDRLPPADRESLANAGKASVLMNEYLADPVMLRQTIRDVIESACSQINADAKRVSAIGFCFGGTCALEAFRDGVDLKAAVAVHATLDGKPIAPLDGKSAAPPVKTRAPNKYNPATKILVATGAKDPLVPRAHIEAFEAEMAAAKHTAYSVLSFAGATHAFTYPDGGRPNKVMAFNADASRLTFVAAIDLLRQTMGMDASAVHAHSHSGHRIASTLGANDLVWVSKL